MQALVPQKVTSVLDDFFPKTFSDYLLTILLLLLFLQLKNHKIVGIYKFILKGLKFVENFLVISEKQLRVTHLGSCLVKFLIKFISDVKSF